MPLIIHTPFNIKTNLVRVTQFAVDTTEVTLTPSVVTQFAVDTTEVTLTPSVVTQFAIGVVSDQANIPARVTQLDIGVVDQLSSDYPDIYSDYEYTFRADAHPMNGHIGYIGSYGVLSPNSIHGETVAALLNTPDNKTMLAVWGSGKPQDLFLVMVLDNKVYYASTATYDPSADLAGIGAGLGTSWTWNVDSNLVGNTYYQLMIY